MRDEYVFSNSTKNVYAKKTKKQVTINLDVEVIEYFKYLAEIKGIPYQTLINMYLSYCVEQNMQIDVKWKAKAFA